MVRNEGVISVTEDEKKTAFFDLAYSYARARIRAVFRRALRKARMRIATRKGGRQGQ